MRRLLMFVPVLLVAGMISVPAFTTPKDNDNGAAKDRAKETEKIHAAEAALKASVTAPDKGIPKDLLEKAECVGVFPDVKKGAFIVGGEGGKGVFTCRKGNGMSGPAFFKIGGPSIGWQAGVESADLVLLIMNKEGIDKLLTDKFKIGADATAAAGPVGRNTQASTDVLMGSQILSWSRTKGLFAGISLEGMVMTQDKEDNAAIYGKAVEAREVLTTTTLPVPQVAKSFIKTTEQYVRPVS